MPRQAPIFGKGRRSIAILTLPVLPDYLDDGDYRHNLHPRVGCRDSLGGSPPPERVSLFIDSLEPDATLPSEVVSGVADVPAPPDHALKAGISLRFSVNASLPFGDRR